MGIPEGAQDRGHVSERFRRLLSLYRRPDGSEWGGQDLEHATGGVVSRSYVSNLKKGRIENPGLAKLGAIAGAMGFEPALWFGEEGDGGPSSADRGAAEEDETVRAVVEETLRLGQRERELLLRIARQIPARPGTGGASGAGDSKTGGGCG